MVRETIDGGGLALAGELGDGPVTEAQIERLAERRMDALDRDYMTGWLTKAEYQAGVDRIDREANRLYQAAKRAGAV